MSEHRLASGKAMSASQSARSEADSPLSARQGGVDGIRGGIPLGFDR